MWTCHWLAIETRSPLFGVSVPFCVARGDAGDDLHNAGVYLWSAGRRWRRCNARGGGWRRRRHIARVFGAGRSVWCLSCKWMGHCIDLSPRVCPLVIFPPPSFLCFLCPSPTLPGMLLPIVMQQTAKHARSASISTTPGAAGGAPAGEPIHMRDILNLILSPVRLGRGLVRWKPVCSGIEYFRLTLFLPALATSSPCLNRDRLS